MQAEWYARLKAEGFDDAERLVNGEPMLRQFSARIGREETPEAYFTLLRSHVSATVFQRESDRIIMTMHADGSTVAEILETLQLMPPRFPPRFLSPHYRCRRNRQTIRFTIRKFEAHWGLKTYSRRQLGDYREKDAS